MNSKSKRILITVKAYPNPSKKYGETVCCAGVDLTNYQWVRLYPIPYRDLDSDQKFKKYSIIEASCSKDPKDGRVESFRVDSDSIKVIEWLDTKNGWKKRKSHVLRLPITSMCTLLQDTRTRNLSLGLVKPQNVTFSWEKRRGDDAAARKACYAQLSFFDKKKREIEPISYMFYYHFHCHRESNCPGHKLSIIDWEIGQAYRDWRSKYDSIQTLLCKIQQRWLKISDAAKNDVHFYVGNMQRFPDNFMVLGVFYPPKLKA